MTTIQGLLKAGSPLRMKDFYRIFTPPKWAVDGNPLDDMVLYMELCAHTIAPVYTLVTSGFCNLDVPEYLCWLSGLAEAMAVKNPECASHFTTIGGWNEVLEIVPEMACALDVSRLTPPAELRDFCSEGRVLGVNLRPCKEHDETAFAERMAETLAKIHEVEGLRILGIPFQMPSDNEVLRHIFSLLPDSIPCLIYEPESDDNLCRILGALKYCDLLLSMRLHPALVAQRLGVPAVGLTHSQEAVALFGQLDCPELCLSPDAPLSTVFDTMSRILTDITGYRERLQQNIPPLEEKARQGLEQLRQRILEAAPPDKVYVLDQESATAEGKSRTEPVKPAVAQAPLLCFPIENSDLSLSSRVWQLPANAPGFRLEQRIGALRFTCQNAEPCYLKQDARSFNRPPGSRVSAKLEPDRDYILVVDNLSTCGAEDVILYVMEYAGDIRVQTTQGCMASPRGMLRFHTTPSTDTFRVAIRFSGTGIVELRDVRLFAPEPGE